MRADKQDSPSMHDFDNIRDDKTDNPLGLSWWTAVLYFELWNRAEFEANQVQSRRWVLSQDDLPAAGLPTWAPVPRAAARSSPWSAGTEVGGEPARRSPGTPPPAPGRCR